MPTNLYRLRNSFNLPATSCPPLSASSTSGKNMASRRSCCGAPTPSRREFLYVDDLAEACVLVMDNYSAAGLST
jgi:GDP-L-fucose synthase